MKKNVQSNENRTDFFFLNIYFKVSDEFIVYLICLFFTFNFLLLRRTKYVERYLPEHEKIPNPVKSRNMMKYLKLNKKIILRKICIKVLLSGYYEHRFIIDQYTVR